MNDKFRVPGLSKENFSLHIRKFVAKYHLTYLEAINEVMTANQIEPEDIKSVLSEDILFQVRSEALRTSMIKPVGGKNKLIFEDD